MTQMTSNVAPVGGTFEDGVFLRRPDDPIGSFNHVLVRYGSSDAHAGVSPHDVEPEDGCDACTPQTTPLAPSNAPTKGT